MTNEVGEVFMFYQTAKDIWDAMKESFSNKDNTSELFEIKGILADLKQGDSTITQYFNTLNWHWQQLDLVNELVFKEALC